MKDWENQYPTVNKLRESKGLNPIPWPKREQKSSSWFEQVRKFSDMGNGPLPKRPVMMTLEQVKFIRQMVNDEMDELERDVNAFWNSDESEDTVKDFVKVADAHIDAIYYLMDSAAKLGIDLDKLFEIIQSANMAKFKNGVNKREDGKILKPADWEDPEPKLIAEMRKQIGK